MKKTILIVDDFATTLQSISLTLQLQGYNVLKAENGEGALKLLNHNEVHLVISDYNMPGMNGLELTEAIRKKEDLKGLPILILSTDNSPEKKNEAIKKGITGWIKKPYKLDEFQKLISRVIK